MRLFSIFYFLFSRPVSRKGFTLIELLLFVAIFSIIIVAFITILVAVMKVQVRQSSTTEVTTQSQFLLQAIEYYTERSSLIDIPQDTPTSTLKLRMPSLAEDPTYITVSNGTAYLQQAGGAQQPLTSSKVTVTGLTFTKHSNPPGHDTVTVSYTLAYNSSSSQQNYTESLETAIARVSAATFDSSVNPSSSNQYSLGTYTAVWNNINGVIYFNGSNVGIASTSFSPTRALQVRSGDVYIDTAGNALIIHDPTNAYCWWYKPTAGTGALSYSSSTCP